MHKFYRILLIQSVLALSLAGAVLAANYSIIDLGEGVAWDINNSGQVVGDYYAPDLGRHTGFYWDAIKGRVVIDFGDNSSFLSINDAGVAVLTNSFLWNSTNGDREAIPIFGNAINDSGHVTGWASGGPGGGDLAVVWTETNGVQAIGGGINGNGLDINDYGLVAGRMGNTSGGFDGFIWDETNGLKKIPTLGGDSTEANGINNLGQVVGFSHVSLTNSESHAFIWDEINGTQDLGTLGYRTVGSDDSGASDINLLGQVVGRSNAISSTDPSGHGGWNAFIWDSVNGMRDLNKLIPSGTGWVLGTAYAINDYGEIVGYGGLNGVEHAFLLTPLDTDSDNVTNDIDNCIDIPNPNQTDFDKDGIGDVCDTCPLDAENDIDEDGICGDVDNCPNDANTDQANFDNDTNGNVCDIDDDNDGINDVYDNCPFDANPDQLDSDYDGFGNICDSDDDNDGVIDGEDQCIETAVGEVVNEFGCSIDELCPCGNEWKNHGSFVKCVAQTSESFVLDGLISEADKSYIVSIAGASICGHKNK